MPNEPLKKDPVADKARDGIDYTIMIPVRVVFKTYTDEELKQDMRRWTWLFVGSHVGALIFAIILGFLTR